MHTWCHCLSPTACLPVHFILNPGHVEYELGVLTVWKLSQPEQVWNPWYPAWKSSALTTRPHSVPVLHSYQKAKWYYFTGDCPVFLSYFDEKETQNAYTVFITKTNLYNFDLLKPHFYIVKLGFTGIYIIFLFSAKKHRLWVLIRTPQQGGFNKYPQSMFWAEIWKIPEFLSGNFQFLVVKFSIYLNRCVFVMDSFFLLFWWAILLFLISHSFLCFYGKKNKAQFIYIYIYSLWFNNQHLLQKWLTVHHEFILFEWKLFKFLTTQAFSAVNRKYK